MTSFSKVATSMLYVSQPEPYMFGNPRNTPTNKEWTEQNWLTSRFHFSFAEYHNYKNQNFGVLRVCNDDIVQPDRGFGQHPHRDMLIVTNIINGELSHAHRGSGSSATEKLGRGSAQYMCAGTGVVHSELNEHKQDFCRFIQMWIVPRKNGLPVQYGGLEGNFESRYNVWQHQVQDVKNPKDLAPIKFDQDCNIFISEFDIALEFKVGEGRQAYVLNVEGDTSVQTDDNDKCYDLEMHEGAEVKGPLNMTFKPIKDGKKSYVLIVEMAKDSSTRFR